MKIDRIGKLLYAYQTDVYFQVHQHSLRGILKLEHLYIPILICRKSIEHQNPVFILDKDVKIHSDYPINLPEPSKWIK